MNTLIIQVLTAAAMILSIIIPMAVYFSGEKTKKRYKRFLAAPQPKTVRSPDVEGGKGLRV